MVDSRDDRSVSSNITLNKEEISFDDDILNVSCLDPGDHEEDGWGGVGPGSAILGAHQSLHLTHQEQMLPREAEYCALQTIQDFQ